MAPPTAPLRVLIADGQALFRRGVRAALEADADFQVCGEAADTEAALLLLGGGGVDLVLVDRDLPPYGALPLIREVAASQAQVATVLLTTGPPEADLLAAVQAGAVGCVGKSVPDATLVQALRGYHLDGRLPISGSAARSLLAALRQREAPAPTDGPMRGDVLTPRQQEVFALLASGARDRDVAAQLGITEGTAKRHAHDILRKLGARTRSQAVAQLTRASSPVA